MKNTLLNTITILFLLFVLLSCGDDDIDTTISHITSPEELTAALTTIHSESLAPGFTVSIVRDKDIIYQNSFGKSNIENNKSYNNKTIQPIGSISKTIVGAAIVKAIDQGHFTLETNINDILPLDLINPKQPDMTIKVRHLVTHTSGLLDEQEAYFNAYHILSGEDTNTPGYDLLTNELGLQQREPNTLEDFLGEYYLEDGDHYSLDNFASTSPGENWNYSNIATSLAAYLIESTTSKPFNDYVRSNILEPLGMSNTSYANSTEDDSNNATLYWDLETPLPKYGNDSYPDGSIHTNNEDLSKFLLDMMNGAKGQSTILFSKESYALLFEALLPTDISNLAIGENQGVFWLLDDDNIKHDGSDPGTTCNLQFNEDGNTGYFFLSNMDASTAAHQTAYFDLSNQVHNAIMEFIQSN